jgi:hypothetical protein
MRDSGVQLKHTHTHTNINTHAHPGWFVRAGEAENFLTAKVAVLTGMSIFLSTGHPLKQRTIREEVWWSGTEYNCYLNYLGSARVAPRHSLTAPTGSFYSNANIYIHLHSCLRHVSVLS